MKKIGIIICGRYQDCGGGKCFRAVRERAGSFSRYPKEESVEVVGYSYCAGIHDTERVVQMACHFTTQDVRETTASLMEKK